MEIKEDLNTLLCKYKNKIGTMAKFETPEHEIKSFRKNTCNFNYDGFSLDLTYITDRIIAMRFPHKEVVSDLNRLFSMRHNNKVKVYNLCSEFTYEGDVFRRQARFPFNDHEVPALETLFDLCEDIRLWLEEDSENVIAVHCLAGLGRTGLVISSYLLYSKFVSNPSDAIAYFRKMRAVDGICIRNPCQVRYVNYFHNALKENNLFAIENLNLKQVTLRNFGEKLNEQISSNEITISVHIHSNGKIIEFPLQSDSNNNNELSFINKDANTISLKGDLKFEFVKYHLMDSNKQSICSVFINTFCLNDSESVKFYKNEIDEAFKDKEHNIFSENFEFEVLFK